MFLFPVIIGAQSEHPMDEADFDFWVGYWEVTWDEGDGKIGKGTSVIVKDFDQKALVENFKILKGLKKGYQGKRISVFNPISKEWKQAWTNNSGTFLSLKGNLDSNGNPVFITEAIENDSKKNVSKMTFKNVSKDSLTWNWESSKNKGKNWNLNWQIKYRRIVPDSSINMITDFSPMIGTCRCKSSRKDENGKWTAPIDAMWTFKYIMNGRGVQDEFFLANGLSGGSIRQYNDKDQLWYVHYYASNLPTPKLQSWKGSKDGEGNIILYSKQKSSDGDDGFLKLTFHEISDNGYKWKGEWVNSDESIKNAFWNIECLK